jgi:hypothetical protein
VYTSFNFWVLVYNRNHKKYRSLASIWAINNLAGIVISVKILGLKFLQFIAVKATIARLLEALHIVGTSKTEKRGD